MNGFLLEKYRSLEGIVNDILKETLCIKYSMKIVVKLLNIMKK